MLFVENESSEDILVKKLICNNELNWEIDALLIYILFLMINMLLYD